MPASDVPAEYRRRRDFRRTAEPSGDGRPGRREAPSFVVQIHDASTTRWHDASRPRRARSVSSGRTLGRVAADAASAGEES